MCLSSINWRLESQIKYQIWLLNEISGKQLEKENEKKYIVDETLYSPELSSTRFGFIA